MSTVQDVPIAKDRQNGQNKQDEQNGQNERKEQNGDNSDSNGDAEKGDGPPAAVNFWDHSLKQVRNEVFSKWILTTVVLMIFILGVLSICQSSPHERRGY